MEYEEEKPEILIRVNHLFKIFGDNPVRGVDLLRAHLASQGLEECLEIRVVEEQSFNIVRGFSTAGKNYRLKLQTDPGILPEWRLPC